MMNKSLFYFFLLAFPLTLGLTACGDSDDDDSTPPQNEVPPTDDSMDNGKDDDGDDPANGEAPDSLYGSRNTTDPVVTGGCYDLTMTTISIYGYVNTRSAISKGVYYATDENFADRRQATGNWTGNEMRRFQVSLSGLQPDTRYYYYAYLNDGNDKVKTGNVCSFTTKRPENVLAVEEARNITAHTAVIPCQWRDYQMLQQLLQLGGQTSFGVAYSTNKFDLSAIDGVLAEGVQKAYLGSDSYYETGDMSVTISGLPSASTIYYAPFTYYSSSYGSSSGKYYLGSVSQFTTSAVPLYGGHEAVDLGLSVMWATTNLGAEKPEDYGLYFAWGETVGYGSDTSDGHLFDWASYKWYNGASDNLTKYCTRGSYGTVDNKTTLDLEDDAAYVNWGDNWRMPTKTEIQELLDNTTSEWINLNGVNGYRFTATNGNSVFLPAAGYRWDSVLTNAGSFGLYWSSTLLEGSPRGAYYLYFDCGHASWSGSGRYGGQSVRPVR